jgi:hypothetical protein
MVSLKRMFPFDEYISIQNFIRGFLIFFGSCASLLQTYGTDELGAVFEKIINDLEHYLQNIIGNQGVIPSNCQVGSLHGLLEALMIARKSRDTMSAISLLQKVRCVIVLYSFKCRLFQACLVFNTSV